MVLPMSSSRRVGLLPESQSPLFPGGEGKGVVTKDWCRSRKQYASRIVETQSLTSLHSSTYFIFGFRLYLHDTGSRTTRATY